MQIEYTLVRELRPYSRNARTHSKKQIRQIADSIKRFGFNNAVLIDDNNQIIAGHGRVEAAKLLGHQAVPTVKLSHLSEGDKRAFILADNKLALKAGWDREILAIELQGLIDLGCDIEVTGFETAEVDIILEDAAEATEAEPGPEDAVPAAPERAVTRPGDLWLLRQHRLICGDSRTADTYQFLMKGMKAEFVFTDPPYNVRIDGNVTGLGHIRHREFAMASGEMTEAEFTAFLEGVFRQLVLNSVDGSIHQICMDWRHLSEMMTAGRQIYTQLKNLCVWNKCNAGMGTFYRSQHELIFIWKNGDGPHVNNFELGQHGRTRTNVWTYPGMAGGGAGRLDQLALHPTIKPVALVADAIKDCSSRGGVVLDAFCGSGTILIAAERTGRKAFAIELDPGYVDVAVRRWQLYTGKTATLEATGESFEQVEEARTIPPAAA